MTNERIGPRVDHQAATEARRARRERIATAAMQGLLAADVGPFNDEGDRCYSALATKTLSTFTLRHRF